MAAAGLGFAALVGVGAAPPASAGTTTSSLSAVPLGQRVAFGAFAAGFGGAGSQISQFEQLLGGKLAVASSYQGLGDVFPDPSELADARSGHTLLISWDLSQSAASRYSAFAAGTYDAYLTQVADSVRSFGQTIYIRPWPEMNGDWSSFQPTASGTAPAGGTPAEFIAAWRHLVSLFRQQGATNVRWVFNPYAATYAQTTPVSAIWPGSDYVDVLGLDGFNWGTGGVQHWQSFASIMQPQYDNLVALDPAAPVWICEFASKEPLENDGAPVDPTNSKAAWYSSLLGSTGFSHVTALVMFEINKERDWRVQSDPAALAVVSDAVRTAPAVQPGVLPPGTATPPPAGLGTTPTPPAGRGNTTPPPTGLSGGQRLSARSRLANAAGDVRLVMQRDGNLVLYRGARALWASRTARHPGAFAVLQRDGNLVVYSSTDRAMWSSATYGHAGDRLVLQADDNLVIYRGARALWATGTNR